MLEGGNMDILVMQTCGDEDGNFPDAECAIVNIEKPLVGLIKKRLALAKSVKKKCDGFFSMNLRDWSPLFISSDTLDEKLGPILPEGWRESGYVVVKTKQPDLDSLLADVKCANIQTCFLTVADNSFWWTANPKHSYLDVSTTLIYAKNNEEIDSLLAG
jgi:hypothetical protein